MGYVSEGSSKHRFMNGLNVTNAINHFIIAIYVIIYNNNHSLDEFSHIPSKHREA